MSHFKADAVCGYEEGLKFGEPQPNPERVLLNTRREREGEDRKEREKLKGVLYLSKRRITLGIRV